MPKLVQCFKGHFNNPGTPVCWCGSTTYEDDIEATVQNPVQENVQTVLITLTQRNEILLKHLANIQITNNAQKTECEDMLINARAALKDGKSKLAELLEPLVREQETIKGAFKPFITQLTTGTESINNALGGYHQKQENIAQEERNRILTEQAHVIAMSKETGQICDMTVQPLPEVAKTSQANVGSVSYIDGFDLQITDASLIPRQYCDPNPVKLRAAIKSGVKEIPGVLVIAKKILQTRHK